MNRFAIGLFAIVGVIASVCLPVRAVEAPDDAATLLQAAVLGHLTVEQMVGDTAEACQCAPPAQAAPVIAAGDPSIDVGSASGSPGDQVTFAVTLSTAGAVVAAAQNDIAFDSINTPVAATSMGRPDCAVNPSINKEATAFAFQPPGCSGGGCTGMRAIVLSTINIVPIPDGSVLYTCNVGISATAPNGSYPLVISNIVLSDPNGNRVPGVTGTDGAIVVSGSPFPTPTPLPTPTPFPVPPNDDFSNASIIGALPFSDSVDTTAATREAGEPTSSCESSPLSGTVWYAFTSAQSESVLASVNSSFFPSMVAAYTGTSLTSLTEVGCRNFGSPLTLVADAGTTYYFQVAGLSGTGGPLQFNIEITPVPVASFFYLPPDPSVFDVVQFFDSSYDPGGVGFQSFTWDFGDGTTATSCCPTHQYAAEGDYTVQETVTTFDGREASVSQVVHVRTHDVAITKFMTPNAAKAGQTRNISVGVTSKRYAENVRIDLFRSAPGVFDGFELVGSLNLFVPVRPSNRTTEFDFSYTFTSADAAIGKVTFKAVASMFAARDALPADNTAISSPAKVSP